MSVTRLFTVVMFNPPCINPPLKTEVRTPSQATKHCHAFRTGRSTGRESLLTLFMRQK
jgi:hypothetical protein